MAPADRVLIAGETLVDFVPQSPDTPADIEGYTPRFGGAPANVALAMARFADPPLFWTRLSADDFGTFLRRKLSTAGIPDDHLVTDPAAKTTIAVVTHDETGDRSFSFYRDGGAETRMERGTVADAALEEVGWVHTSGVPLSVEPSRTAILDLQARATDRASAMVSIDPNWRPELWASANEYRAVVRGALEHVDVVTASRADLAAAGFDADAPEAMARDVTDHGPHTVVVTLGDDGACCYGTADSPVAGTASHDGYDVEVVDTTGAGDVFLAAFIAAVTNGVTDGHRALALGNAAGAVATTQSGAVTALDDLEDVRRFHDEIPWAD